MILEKAREEHIARLVELSKAAFDSDASVGAPEPGGPPGYDSEAWHIGMMNQGHLFSAIENETVIGGALLFKDASAPDFLYVGRIFIDPALFGQGYGIHLMELIENLFTNKRLRERVSQCRQKMDEGVAFPEAVGDTGIFEPLHCRMISVGFRAGQTDRVMSKLAALYDEEVNTQIGHLVSIIEPSLVALMSIIIGAILMSVMLPLLSIMSSIG